MNAIFISFDGPDNVGKTTLINEIINKNPNLRFSIYSESHKYKSEKFFKSSTRDQVDAIFDARQELLPGLLSEIFSGNYDFILADRYYNSTLAYQFQETARINSLYKDCIFPDFKVILNPEKSFQSSGLDLFDADDGFQKKLRYNFESISSNNRDIIYLTKPETYYEDFKLALSQRISLTAWRLNLSGGLHG